MNRELSWWQVHLPVPVEPEAAVAALTALAGLAGSPRIVCETIGSSGVVGWRLASGRHAVATVKRVLAVHIPGVRFERDTRRPDRERPVLAVQVRLPGSDRLPLTDDKAGLVARGVLDALAHAGKGEMLQLQLVLGRRLRPHRVPEPEVADRRLALAKFSQHGFECALRVAAAAQTQDRARQLVAGVGAALHGVEAPGVRRVLHRISPRSVVSVTNPWWPLLLRVSDIVPLLGWPTAEPPLPGVPDPRPRVMPPSDQLAITGRLLGKSVATSSRMVAMSVTDSLRHLHVLGPTGVGKSTLLAHLALQDIRDGRGVVVIDPKGDLVDDILSRAPVERRDDVVVLDARDPMPVGINGLAGPGDPDLAADTLLSVFRSLYADSWGPRTHDVLHASLLTLARRGDASLVMVPLLLSNPGFRRSVVGRQAKADPMGLGPFWAWFGGISDAERATVVAPLMNKLRPILLRPGLRAVFGQRQPKFALGDVYTKRRVFLVSLAKGTLGPEASQLLGSVVVALLWQAALGRIAVSAAERTPVMVYIDEVQDYLRLPGDLGDALAQARGLGVGFTLAHQHLGQLPASLKSGIMANASSRVSFRLSPDDARVVAATTAGLLDPGDFQMLPAYRAYGQLLAGGTVQPPVSLETMPLGLPTRSAAEALRYSAIRFGQPLDEIERDLLALTETATGQPPGTPERLGRTPHTNHAPTKGGTP